MKRRFALFLTLVLIFYYITPILTLADTKEKKNASLEISAVSVVLLEGSTGEIIFEKDKDKELVPASITKIMTLVLIFEALEKGKIKLEDTVTVSEAAAGKGGSQVYLEPNETQTVNDMIKCIAIASANDAATAMAEHLAGSEAEFVNQMNEKAKELGMKHTQFKNCTGLDDDITSGHYTSAYDVALMSRELVTKHPEIKNYSTVWMDKIIHKTKKGESEFGLTNTNKLVRFYSGITGLKTGSTSKAKYCLSATANRNGMDLIAVVMAAPDVKARFSEASSLLDYGFANCSLYTDAHENLKLEPQKVTGGVKREVNLKPQEPFHHTFTASVDTEKIKSSVTYTDNFQAPLKEGSPAGKIIYSLDGKELGSVNLVIAENIKKAGYGDMIVQIMDLFFKVS